MSLVQVQEILQVALTVDDVQRAKEFYADVLGMRFLFDAGNMAFFQCGSVRVLIGAGEVKAGGTILYLRVADLEGTHAALQSRGVEIAQAPHMVARMPDHELWLAFVKDPDGNLLGLMEEKR
jgi:methylmalonyl-CoA/ethylmalonyl-CoA epimerase